MSPTSCMSAHAKARACQSMKLLYCCRLTFIVGACTEALAMLLAVVLYYRTRVLYRKNQQLQEAGQDRLESSR